MPEGEARTPKERRGALGWMASNPVAANLVMLVLIVGGLLAGFRLKQEVFPEFALDAVNVTVPYPGASPEDVEQGIVLAIEEAVRGLEGVKRVESTSKEGMGRVTAQLLLGADPDQVLADVKSAIDRIETFPADAEEPTVSLGTNRRQVISLIVSGDQDLRVLHEIAEDARHGLLATGKVTQVELEGVPPLEVAVEIPRQTLEKYNLSLQDVAGVISGASLELPGGTLQTKSGDILVRVADRRRFGHELHDIVLTRTETGSEVRLGDVATISDGYEDVDKYSLFDGKPAIRMTAYRVGAETPTAVAEAVHAYSDELRAKLPGNISVDVWRDDSEILRDRLNLLLKNAGLGLVCVVIILAVFMDIRLSFWVALGIPISFLGALLVLGPADISINMVTTFAFIVTLGMVVDDAIVVGERTFTLREKGMSAPQAAVAAAKEMVMPVTFAILTTVAAFAPLFFVPGTMGRIFKLIPAVVISVLVLSLLESFFVLPAHLAHSKGGARAGKQIATRALAWFVQRIYRPLAAVLVRARYLTVAAALSLLVITIGSVASGRVPFNFFPVLEGDIVKVEARLPFGSPVTRTEAVGRALTEAAEKTIEAYGGHASVRGVFTRVGEEAPRMGPSPGEPEVGGHIVSVEINLVPPDDRSFNSGAFLASWQDNTPELAGLESISFTAALGPSSGEPVAVALKHEDTEVLAEASGDLFDTLLGFKELINVRNGYAEGKPQLDFHLRPEARALGLTSAIVAQQLRAAFYGAEALREQRDRDEVKIVARLPEAQRSSEHDLAKLMIRTPAGGYVPLGYVADFERGSAATTITREDGIRYVTVTAELAPGIKSPREVLANLDRDVLPKLRERYPGLAVGAVGQQREQQETFKALGQNYVLGLFVIFALLAIPFRSYIQPVVVMFVIPFGMIGAVGGHVLTGYSMSLMSMFGIVALSGVVVNDSLVLVDATNRIVDEGRPPREAIIEAGATRFRPILLTSLTTFFGLAPMILETSVQAQFLVPMAISLGFGVLFTTFVVLLVVPAVYSIIEDVRDLFR